MYSEIDYPTMKFIICSKQICYLGEQLAIIRHFWINDLTLKSNKRLIRRQGEGIALVIIL